jgi:hypothetical protein
VARRLKAAGGRSASGGSTWTPVVRDWSLSAGTETAPGGGGRGAAVMSVSDRNS